MAGMRVALCSSVVPFVQGGARNIVEWLEVTLRDAGHDVERIYLPHVDAPDLLLRQIAAYRWVDLTESADRVIGFRPPAHHIRHPHKILWFIHHVRTFYDLWGTEHRGFPDDVRHRGIRDALRAADTGALHEAERVFSNSQVVADRLERFNGVASEVLYPPLLRPERFECRTAGDEIVCISRLEAHKRQVLLIDAMRYARSGVRLRIAGTSSNPGYGRVLDAHVRDAGLQDRVSVQDRWISESEKIDALADCLAVAYAPLDEDSYGYASLEAAHASKPVLTTRDSGGVLELVEDGVGGIVVDPDPVAIAEAMDRLFEDRNATRRMGESLRERVDALDISWPHVLERLLA
jgi:glycosyltransferase involved in cell wall biosynthesis